MKKAAPSLLLCLGLALAVPSAPAQNAPGTPLPATPPAPAPGQPQRHEDQGKKPPFIAGKMELEMRDKLETLSKLSPQELDAELQKWPRYQQMDLGERAKLLQRIQEFKDRRHKAAENKARELGLQLPPEQFAKFEQLYWEKRTKADRQLWQEMEPRRKALDQQINSELKQEFGSPGAPSAPPPAAPATAPLTPAMSGTTP